jgi:hypothetical protein
VACQDECCKHHSRRVTVRLEHGRPRVRRKIPTFIALQLSATRRLCISDAPLLQYIVFVAWDVGFERQARDARLPNPLRWSATTLCRLVVGVNLTTLFPVHACLNLLQLTLTSQELLAFLVDLALDLDLNLA